MNLHSKKKPLLIYDGTCGFCMQWIGFWKQLTNGYVEYAASQEVGALYPRVPPEQFEKSVVLILYSSFNDPFGNETSWSYFTGAEAVFKSLAAAPSLTSAKMALRLYENLGLFRWLTETLYSFVAGHRVLFSRLTRLFFGKNPKPASFYFSRCIFLRLMALIYLIAFASLGLQLPGLVGSQGILSSPWSDSGLQALWLGGIGLSALLLIGIAPALCLIGLWISYFLLSHFCGEFLWFQWDALLLEAGFLAIFLSPWTLRSKPLAQISTEPAPSRPILFLFKWLLFRVVFFSGWVKLASGDPTWRSLTALSYHFQTQPLPTWPSWYVHQLPSEFLQGVTVLFLGIELVVPFLIFFPGRARILAALILLGLQLLIDFTGNYGFFGWQVTALALLCLDDRFWLKWLRRLSFRVPAFPFTSKPLEPAFKRWVAFGVLTAVLMVTPLKIEFMMELLGPFHIANGYGVFAVMTTHRIELVIEGSQDGQNWLPYEFKWKPGDLRKRPGFVEPHMPRLDWQMWFAALGNIDENPWLKGLVFRLLQGKPEVLKFFEKDPFLGTPPHYVRILKYEYYFTDFNERKTSGQWWKREPRGTYSPTFSI